MSNQTAGITCDHVGLDNETIGMYKVSRHNSAVPT